METLETHVPVHCCRWEGWSMKSLYPLSMILLLLNRGLAVGPLKGAYLHRALPPLSLIPCHSPLLRRKPNSLEPNWTITFRKFRSRDQHRPGPQPSELLPDCTVSPTYVPLEKAPGCWAGGQEPLWMYWLSALHRSQTPRLRQSLAHLLELLPLVSTQI